MLVAAEDTTSVAVKLGVVYLGTVCGKHKYTLLEEADIDFVRKHSLEANVEVDPNGTEACVYAVVKNAIDGSVRYFHKMLWLEHERNIPQGCSIVHKNGISVDNRLSNLELVQIDPVSGARARTQISSEEVERRSRSGDIYRLALSRLPSFDTVRPVNDKSLMYDADGIEVQEIHPTFPFYECRNAACCSTEDPTNGFRDVCSHCPDARYCSRSCLEQDKKRHQRECVRRTRPQALRSVTCVR
eukprot:m.76606 g.76606  ORF g.76606 m.76606 type:complete len:243 (-) comp24919_c0_seq1:459-1187(-)